MEESIRFQHFEVLRRPDGTLHELGRGAMGVTYKAFDTNLRCHVALKVISPNYLDSEIARQRFLREARAAAAIRHPNVATVFHLGNEGDTWFYAMEFVDGETVEEMMRRDGAVPAAKALEISDQVARALGAAQKQGLVHRDIKPSNLMLVHEDGGDFTVKVIDFGLAKATDRDSSIDPATLTTGGFLGTPHFASPEQLDERDLDVRSDIYSLGVTLYYMLAGTTPFSGSLAQVMSQHLHRDPPLDRLVGQPTAVIRLLERMLEKSADARPQSSADLRREIDLCLSTLSSASAATGQAATVFPVESDTLMETAISDELVSISPEPAPGVTLAGRFKLMDEFPTGQYGRTFRAQNLETHETVAVLILHAAVLPTSGAYTRLEDEITALQSVHHPAVIRVDSVEHTEHLTFITREWIDGPSLQDHLKKRRLDPAGLMAILESLAGGMDAVQAAGVPCPELALGWITAIPRETGICPKFNPINLSKVAPVSPTGKAVGGAGLQRGQMMDSASGATFAFTLAALGIEILGGTRSGSGEFVPVPGLNEDANQVLRKAISGSFLSAGAFYQALAPTILKPDSASVPPKPSFKRSESPKAKSSLVLGIVGGGIILLLIAGIGAVWILGVPKTTGIAGAGTPARDLALLDVPTPTPEPVAQTPTPTPLPTPTPTPEEDPAETVIKNALAHADELSTSGNYKLALTALTELTTLHPADSRPLEKLENVAAKLRAESEVISPERFKDLEDPLRDAAQTGSPSAQMLLARAFDGVNENEAFKFFLLAAEAGNSEAMLEVGDRYASGRGVDRNLESAFPWFERAASKGEPRALYSIGECYYFGAGVPKDLNQAIYYLTQSAAFNDPYAKGLLGNIYRKGEGLEKPNYQEAFRLLSEASNQGFLDAQGNLGVMIINGEVIAEQPVTGAPMPEKADQKSAVALFQDGAEKGNALCTFFYAQSLEGGVGIPKPDLRAAREQYIKAAELGNPAAQQWCRDKRIKFSQPER